MPPLPPEELQARLDAGRELTEQQQARLRAHNREQRVKARTGWFRSPSGNVAHADGPDQKRAYSDRGWTEIDEADAKEHIASGVQIGYDADTRGTFDADTNDRAVRDESTVRPQPPAGKDDGEDTESEPGTTEGTTTG